MKITQADYDVLRTAISPYHSTSKLQAYIDKDLTQRKYVWDLIHLARTRNGFDVCQFYHYLNDDHIDTALRSILKELTH